MCKYGHLEHWCAGTCPVTKGLRPYYTEPFTFCIPCADALARAASMGASFRKDPRRVAKNPFRCHVLARDLHGYPLAEVLPSLTERVKEMCEDCTRRGRTWPDSDDEPEEEEFVATSAYRYTVKQKGRSKNKSKSKDEEGDDEEEEEKEDEYFMVMPPGQGFSDCESDDGKTGHSRTGKARVSDRDNSGKPGDASNREDIDKKDNAGTKNDADRKDDGGKKENADMKEDLGEKDGLDKADVGMKVDRGKKNAVKGSPSSPGEGSAASGKKLDSPW